MLVTASPPHNGIHQRFCIAREKRFNLFYKLPMQIHRSRHSMNHNTYCSTIFSISAGLLTMCPAWYSTNSFSGRNPHVTPTESMQARRAVSMSTPESPTYKESALRSFAWANIENTIDGSGLTGMPSFCLRRRQNLYQGSNGVSTFESQDHTCWMRQQSSHPLPATTPMCRVCRDKARYSRCLCSL